MHTNSLAMAGDYRDLGFLGKGPMVDGLAISAGKRQTEVVGHATAIRPTKRWNIINPKKGTFLMS
jgi:hypothetical protein